MASRGFTFEAAAFKEIDPLTFQARDSALSPDAFDEKRESR